jgi:Uma2 family endonuclease
MNAADYTVITADEYLARERLGEVRHEYIAGLTFAMAGAREAHGLITLNLALALRQHLGIAPCKVFVADMKVRLDVQRADVFFYPDVVVTCDPADNHPYYKARPTFIAEVQSPETADYDRQQKLISYINSPNLQEYLIVSQQEPAGILFRRSTEWLGEPLRAGDTLALPSLNFSMPFDALFAGVAFPPRA